MFIKLTASLRISRVQAILVLSVLALTTCLLVNSNPAQAQSRIHQNEIQRIRELYAAVQQQLPAYRSIEREFEGFSTEGGELKAYFDGDRIRLIKVSLFGETGRSDKEYYYDDTGSLFFVFQKNSRYDRPFGKVVQVYQDRFYFYQGELIQWLNDAKKPVPSSNSKYLEQQKKVLELSQALLQTVMRPPAEVVPETSTSQRVPVAQPLRSLVPRIKQETSVPVLLPSELPYTLKQRPLYASEETSADSYKIILTSRPNCGANACFVGLFKAQRGGKMTAGSEETHEGVPNREKTVLLTDNTKAYYKPLSCGGSCSPPSIEWVSEGVLYSIQFEVQWQTRLESREEEKLMVEMANSAIKTGAR